MTYVRDTEIGLYVLIVKPRLEEPHLLGRPDSI